MKTVRINKEISKFACLRFVLRPDDWFEAYYVRPTWSVFVFDAYIRLVIYTPDQRQTTFGEYGFRKPSTPKQLKQRATRLAYLCSRHFGKVTQ